MIQASIKDQKLYGLCVRQANFISQYWKERAGRLQSVVTAGGLF